MEEHRGTMCERIPSKDEGWEYCEGYLGDNSAVCFYPPDNCGKSGVYKWKTYVDPCPLERTTPSRKVKKYKGEWYQRVSNGDNSSCVKCDFYPDNGLCDPFGEYKCVLSINASNKDYYIWKEI